MMTPEIAGKTRHQSGGQLTNIWGLCSDEDDGAKAIIGKRRECKLGVIKVRTVSAGETEKRIIEDRYREASIVVVANSETGVLDFRRNSLRFSVIFQTYRASTTPARCWGGSRSCLRARRRGGSRSCGT